MFAGGAPSVSVTFATVSARSEASSDVTACGVPPSITGVGSPRRRLNSRPTRSGLLTARRFAASPVTSDPSSRTYTTAGATTVRSPRVIISTRDPRATAAATNVVPRSTPRLYAPTPSDTVVAPFGSPDVIENRESDRDTAAQHYLIDGRQRFRYGWPHRTVGKTLPPPGGDPL